MLLDVSDGTTTPLMDSDFSENGAALSPNGELLDRASDLPVRGKQTGQVGQVSVIYRPVGTRSFNSSNQLRMTLICHSPASGRS